MDGSDSLGHFDAVWWHDVVVPGMSTRVSGPGLWRAVT